MVHATGRARWRGAGALFAVLFTLGLLASACGTSSETDQGQAGDGGAEPGAPETPDLEPDAGPPQPGGKLAYGLVAETDGWDPSKARWAASGFEVAAAIFDRIGAFNENYEVKPFLAQSIEHNENFTEWRIGVRPDVFFHNGDPVDAEAIAINLETYRNGALTKSAMENIAGPITPSADGTEVVITMSRPWSTYPLQFLAQIGNIADPDTLGADGSMTNPIGSGPFKFASWETGSSLTVVKNDDYWREGLPYLDEIEFQVVTDNQARRSALQTGGLDIAEFFDIESITEFRADTSGDYNVLSDPEGEDEEAMIMLNTDAPPFDNIDARRALAMATDVPDVAAFIGPDLEPAMGPISQDSRWYVEGVGNPAYNLEEAKKLVEKVKADTGSFAFTLTGVPVVETQRFSQYLQQMWGEAGIDVTLTDTEQATLINLAVAGDFEALTWRQFGSAHPDGEYVWTHEKNAKPIGEISLNFARNKDPELSAALDTARETDDFETQKEQYGIWQKRLGETVPYIWIYHVKPIVVSRSNVHDVTKAVLPDGEKQLSMTSVVHPLAQIWVDQ
jgi:peptide/nickel transport system substrate-binding protein